MNALCNNSATSLSEVELVDRLAEWLNHQGYRVRTEVANMGQSADVVAIRGRWVTIIEAKLKDWRRALGQCQAHETIADYVCVAFSLVSVPTELKTIAESRGYGLIHYHAITEQFTWAVVPRRNNRVWSPQREYWSKGLKGVALCQLSTG